MRRRRTDAHSAHERHQDGTGARPFPTGAARTAPDGRRPHGPHESRTSAHPYRQTARGRQRTGAPCRSVRAGTLPEKVIPASRGGGTGGDARERNRPTASPPPAGIGARPGRRSAPRRSGCAPGAPGSTSFPFGRRGHTALRASPHTDGTRRDRTDALVVVLGGRRTDFVGERKTRRPPPHGRGRRAVRPGRACGSGRREGRSGRAPSFGSVRADATPGEALQASRRIRTGGDARERSRPSASASRAGARARPGRRPRTSGPDVRP
jgi:hypothetical protein